MSTKTQHHTPSVISHKSFDEHATTHGSIREGKVNPDLAQERSLKDFDQGELTRLIYGASYERHVEYKEMLEKNPIMRSTIDMYDMSREEIMERSMKIINHVVKSPELIRLH